MSVRRAKVRELTRGMWFETPLDLTEVEIGWHEISEIGWIDARRVQIKSPTLPHPLVAGFESWIVAADEEPSGLSPAKRVPGWDEYFLTITEAVATRAKCRRRQV